MLLKENNPWLGLESYSIGDATRFFGRDSDIEVVSNTIYDNFITTIYGISGAGKTSLLNAGLTPELLAHNFLPVRIRLNHSSHTPYELQIIDSIWSAVESVGGEVEYEESLSLYDIPENEKLWFFLHTHKFWSEKNFPIRPVIFIDQFEEIFTKNEDTKVVSDFFSAINAIQFDTPPLNTKDVLDNSNVYQELTGNSSRMVFIIREDFLARLEDYAYGIAALRRNRIGVKRMNGIQALEVIMNPIPGLVSREGAMKILFKVSGKDIVDSKYHLERLSIDTSILSLFCSELYQRACEEGCETISERIIDEFGSDIISQFYKDNMANVPSVVVEYIEKHLLTSSGFRNSVALEDISIGRLTKDEIIDSLTYLAGKRILRIEEAEGVERVEFTHDVLCKVAKHHRDSIKQEQAKKKHNLKSLVRIGDFIILLGLSLVVLFQKTMRYNTMSNVFSPEWLSVLALFALVFWNKNETRAGKWKMLGSVAMTAILLDPMRLIFTYKLEYIWQPMIVLGCSAVLSYFAFVADNSYKTLIKRTLIVMLVVLGIKCSLFAFAGALVLFALFVLVPYRYVNDGNSIIICFMASIILAVCMVVTDVSGLALAFYPILGIFTPKQKSSKSFKESLYDCLQCEFYKEHRIAKNVLLFALFIILSRQSVKYGTSLSDEVVFYAPFLCALTFYVLYELFRFIHPKFCSMTDSERKPFLLKGSVLCGGVSFLIMLCQYITYGYVYVVLICGLLVLYVLRKHANKSKNLMFYCQVAVLLFSVIYVPLSCMGYNLAMNGRYARVPLANLEFNELMVIRDNKGNYGVRDRYDIVVPVEYSKEIKVDVSNINCYNLERSALGWRYSDSPARSLIKNLKLIITYYASSRSDDRIPSIVFTLKDHDGNKVIWDCRDHLDSDNICSLIMVESAAKVLLSDNFDAKTAYECSKIMEEVGRETSGYAKNQMINSFRRYLSVDYEIYSGKKVDETLNDIKDNISKFGSSSISQAVHASKGLFRFIDDESFTTFVLDTLYRKSFNSDAKPYDKWEYYTELSSWYLSAGLYAKAIDCAELAMAQDTSLKYAERFKIEANILSGEYETAVQLLRQYGDGMYYKGKIYNEITDTEERVIHNQSDSTSVLLRYDNICNAVANSLRVYESMGLINDPMDSVYLALKEYIYRNPASGTYDSAEDRGTYYLCRKYAHYEDSYSEIAGRIYGDALEYQFYLSNDGSVLPRFKRYAEGIDEDILLIIDEDTHHRRYVDKTKGGVDLIKGEFNHAWRFSEGLAAVVEDDKIGFINKEGEYVIEPKFDYEHLHPGIYGFEIDIYAREKYNLPTSYLPDLVFTHGLCPMGSEAEGWGLINKTGQWVVNPEYDDVSYDPDMKMWIIEKYYEEGILVGAVGLNGEMLMDVKYDQILYSEEGVSLWGYNDSYIDITKPDEELSLLERRGDSYWFYTPSQELMVYDYLFEYI